ncbi:phage holin family protein [Quadrisphaera sp. KR29]|uniref:phage holin family protein n=1 Tax=Quadrisphaera sp. KR29 TaxID=3461391 RepID=UPI004044E2DB
MTQTPASAGAPTGGQTPPPSTEGVARAVTELAQQASGLVQQEVASAQGELVDKLKANLPAAALLGTAGVFGVFALASAYRWGAALLEKALPPASAAFAGLLLDGALAGAAGIAGARLLREAPAPLPTETARDAQQAVLDVRDQVQQQAPSS